MSICRLLAFFAVLVMHAAAMADPVLEPLGTLETPAARFRAAFGERTLAVTDHDARLVNWNLVEAKRDRVLFGLPAAPTALEAWGDSLLIRLPGQDGRLLVNGPVDPTQYTLEPESWHLPNASIGGSLYRLFVDPLFYLIVYTAPGPGGIVGLLDFEETIGSADLWAHGADRAVLANADGVHVVNLEYPQVPIIQSTVPPPVAGWVANGLAMRDRVLFVRWGDRLQTWNTADPAHPLLLDEITSDVQWFAVGSRWVATWTAADQVVTVLDAGDPAALSIRGSFTVRELLGPDDVVVHGDRLVVRDGDDLASYTVPPGGLPIAAAGDAWPVLAGGLLETAGAAAWLQDRDRRYVLALAGPTVAAVQRNQGGATGLCSLEASEGVLYFDDQGVAVSIESLADPYAPAVLAVLAPDPPLAAVDVAGDLLAATDATGLVLYDVSDPAAPSPLGRLDLGGGPRRVLLKDQTALVTADLPSASSVVYVVDLANPAVPDLIATFSLAYDGNDQWLGGPLVRRGDQALVMAYHADPFGDLVARTLVVSLVDPADPQAAFATAADHVWCLAAGNSGASVAVDDPPVDLSGFHVRSADDLVEVYRYDGDPDTMLPVASWTAPGAVRELATASNRLLVLTDGRLDVLTLTEPDQVGVPATPAAAAVRATPNPFNPRTTLVFALRRAGAVTVDITDALGRRVRTLRADLPGGEVRLDWDGADGGGRALPSGTYLLRIATPDGVLAGRCALVR